MAKVVARAKIMGKSILKKEINLLYLLY